MQQGCTIMRSVKLLALASLALSAACAAPPSSRPEAAAGADWIIAMQQSCQAQPAEEVLRAAIEDPVDLQFVRRVSAIEATLTRRPLLAGNKVSLLIDGPETHRAQLAAIETAQHHIHLEIYILTDDSVGEAYAALLKQKARDGVQVRLLYDGIGGLGAGYGFLSELRAAGVDIHEYNSLNPIKNPLIWRFNRRDHRKLLVVDGRIAFTGGINITDEYLHEAGESEGEAPEGWRDTHIQIEGPAVAELQSLFFKNWQDAEGDIPVSGAYWPHLSHQGDDLLRVVTNGGSDFVTALTGTGQKLVFKFLGMEQRERHMIYQTYLSAILEAQQRIWITQAYFAPNRAFINALVEAANDGVDVRLLMPGESDVPMLLHASRYYYAELLEAGVRLYEYQSAMMHSKTAVVDGVWSTVGSSNLDFRSFVHNDEANAVVIGRDFGRQMEALFERDLLEATEIEAESWKDRSSVDKFKQAISAALKYWI